MVVASGMIPRRDYNIYFYMTELYRYRHSRWVLISPYPSQSDIVYRASQRLSGNIDRESLYNIIILSLLLLRRTCISLLLLL